MLIVVILDRKLYREQENISLKKAILDIFFVPRHFECHTLV